MQAHEPMATRTRNLPRGVVVGILALAYSLLAHLSNARDGHGTLGALLAIGPVGLIALAFAWRSRHRLLGVSAWLIAAALIATRWQQLRAHFVWLYLIQQLGTYGLLAYFFGRTLTADCVPLCTQMALRVHGDLSAAAFLYTRQVTIAWTVFFTVITATTTTLFLAVPLATWSAFANFGIPLLIVAMFVIENRVRRWALPDMTHAGVIATIRASAVGGFGAAERRP
jgi:uncharacterized membrane protein